MNTYSVEHDDADDGVLADVGGADNGCGDGVCDTVVAPTLGGNVKFNLFFFMTRARASKNTTLSLFQAIYIENSLYSD